MVKVKITGTNGWDKEPGKPPAPYLSLVGNGVLYEATGPNERGLFVVYVGNIKQLVHPEDIRMMERFGRIVGLDGWRKQRGGGLGPWYASHIGGEFRIVEKNYPEIIWFDNNCFASSEDVEITARELTEQPV
jgi:hypothetical protein